MKYLYLFFVVIASCRNKSSEPVDNYAYFRQMTDNQNKIIFDTAKKLTVQESIQLVKTHNTIQVYSLENKDSVFRSFQRAFNTCAFQQVTKLLEMQLSVGMTMYSSKYKIWLGSPRSATENYYKLDSTLIFLPIEKD